MGRNATPMKPKPRPGKPAKRQSGARTARTSLGDRFDSWRHHHLASARDAGKRMILTPASSIMTVLVIAIALSLPAGLSVLLDNLRAVTSGWDGNAHLSAFLHMDIDESRQRALASDWLSRDDVLRTEVITRDEALEEYKLLSGFGDALDALPENPLPPLIIVYPRSTSPAALERLQQALSESPKVDVVQLDLEWVRRLYAMIDLGERIIGALALALALAVVLVVVNTIRLAIESRREEIVVVKIVGGTDGFVRRPFLYTGFWYGLAGGVLAVILVQLALWYIATPVDSLVSLYQSDYRMVGLDGEAVLTLPVFAGLLGLMGAWLAVSRHLKDVEPQAF